MLIFSFVVMLGGVRFGLAKMSQGFRSNKKKSQSVKNMDPPDHQAKKPTPILMARKNSVLYQSNLVAENESECSSNSDNAGGSSSSAAAAKKPPPPPIPSHFFNLLTKFNTDVKQDKLINFLFLQEVVKMIELFPFSFKQKKIDKMRLKLLSTWKRLLELIDSNIYPSEFKEESRRGILLIITLPVFNLALFYEYQATTKKKKDHGDTVVDVSSEKIARKYHKLLELSLDIVKYILFTVKYPMDRIPNEVLHFTATIITVCFFRLRTFYSKTVQFLKQSMARKNWPMIYYSTSSTDDYDNNKSIFIDLNPTLFISSRLPYKSNDKENIDSDGELTISESSSDDNFLSKKYESILQYLVQNGDFFCFFVQVWCEFVQNISLGHIEWQEIPGFDLISSICLYLLEQALQMESDFCIQCDENSVPVQQPCANNTIPADYANQVYQSLSTRLEIENLKRNEEETKLLFRLKQEELAFEYLRILLSYRENLQYFMAMTWSKINAYRPVQVVKNLNRIEDWFEFLRNINEDEGNPSSNSNDAGMSISCNLFWNDENYNHSFKKSSLVSPNDSKCPRFRENDFVEGIRILLSTEHFRTTSRVLYFLYHQILTFSDKIQSKILDILTENFNKLFCHWNIEVRCAFHHFLVYRVVYMNRFLVENTKSDAILCGDLAQKSLRLQSINSPSKGQSDCRNTGTTAATNPPKKCGSSEQCAVVYSEQWDKFERKVMHFLNFLEVKLNLAVENVLRHPGITNSESFQSNPLDNFDEIMQFKPYVINVLKEYQDVLLNYYFEAKDADSSVTIDIPVLTLNLPQNY